MSTFLFAYRAPKDYAPSPEAAVAWNSGLPDWFDTEYARSAPVRSGAPGVTSQPALSAAELDRLDDQQDHRDDEVTAEGEHCDLASG